MNEHTVEAPGYARNRLRWRSRRGLLENDVLLTRFLDAHETTLLDTEVAAYTQLLELTDNDLLDLLLERRSLSDLIIKLKGELVLDHPELMTLLIKIRAC
jgi:antitoxin CptB